MQSQAVGKGERSWLRSAGAVLAGLVTIFLLSFGADQAMHSLGVFPPWGEPMTDALFILAFAYRVAIQIGGCYLTASLAPHSHMAHALVLGGIGVVLATAGAIAMWGLGPNWYPVALVVSSLPCAWLGGLLYRRLHAN